MTGRPAARTDRAPAWHPAPTDERAAGAVAAAFTTAFGRPPDGIWAAPGRVNLIGEHVDYNAGLCLPLALPHRAYAALATREDDLVRLRSAQQVGAGAGWEGDLDELDGSALPGWAGYAAGVLWSLRQDGFDVHGVDVAVDSAVPMGAGLSSSASLECCVAIGADELFGLGLGGDDAGRARLAAACVRAENQIAGAPTGGMDQAASLRCTAGHALLLDCRDFGAEQVWLDLAGPGLELLVIDTRVQHELVDGRYGSRRELCAQAADMLGVHTLRELADRAPPGDAGELDAQLRPLGDDERGQDLRRLTRHVVTEIARVREVTDLLRAGRAEQLGPLLDASHRSLREDYQVSCDELDLAVEAARAAGALGARMTGGGFGGSAVALVRQAEAEAVAGAVAAAFGDGDVGEPRFLRAVPSAAARRVA